MQLNFILIFAFIITLFTTIIFALSSTIGTNIIKHEIGTFFETRLVEDYSIENFTFDGLHISFNINMQNRDVVKVAGSVSFQDLVINLDYQITQMSSKWISDFQDIGIFSAFGNIKISIFENIITSKISTAKENIQFKYKKKFISDDGFLEIQKSSILVRNFNKFVNFNLAGNKINLSGKMRGNQNQFDGDLNISIDKINVNGKLKHFRDLTNFQGYSKSLKGEVNLNFSKSEKNIEFYGADIRKILAILQIYTTIKGVGDLTINFFEDKIKFDGIFQKLSFAQNKNLTYLSEILNIEKSKTMFENSVFDGEIINEMTTFNFKTLNSKTDIQINQGQYSQKTHKFNFKSTISQDLNIIGSIQYRSRKPLSIQFTDIGQTKFRTFLLQNSSDKSYQSDLRQILQLY